MRKMKFWILEGALNQGKHIAESFLFLAKDSILSLQQLSLKFIGGYFEMFLAAGQRPSS